MKILKRYTFFLIILLAVIIITVLNKDVGIRSLQLAKDSTLSMLSLLPPILVLAGLMDQWITKDSMIKFMGKESGILGLIFSLSLGVVSAGPLYAAFPIAVILLKKGAAIRYMVFFLGVWTTAKLPILIYEVTSFGPVFSLIHIGTGLLFFYVLGLVFEKIFNMDEVLMSKYN